MIQFFFKLEDGTVDGRSEGFKQQVGGPSGKKRGGNASSPRNLKFCVQPLTGYHFASPGLEISSRGTITVS